MSTRPQTKPDLETTAAPSTNGHVPGRLALATRPHVRGKFLYVGNRKLYLRGVTYGTFRPDEHGCEYGDERTVARDFQQMAAAGDALAASAIRHGSELPKMLAALQLGISAASIALGFTLESIVEAAVEPVVGYVPPALPACGEHASQHGVPA